MVLFVVAVPEAVAAGVPRTVVTIYSYPLAGAGDEAVHDTSAVVVPTFELLNPAGGKHPPIGAKYTPVVVRQLKSVPHAGSK
jgi:hypothetical protein